MCFRRKKEDSRSNVLTKDKIIMERLVNITDEEVGKLAEKLVDGHPLIINFESLEIDDANKILAFLQGVAFARKGISQELRKNLYLFTEENSYEDGTLQPFINDMM